MDRVDSHHHLWDCSAGVPAWLRPPAMERIRRTWTAADLATAAEPAGVDATVLVQTVHRTDETREFLRIAAESPLIRAVTGWVDLEQRDVAEQVAALRAGPGGDYLRGLRHGAQGEPDDHWLARPAVINGVRAATAAGLRYELLVVPRQLGAARTLVRAVPTGGFVLDHAGKPLIAQDGWQPWADQVSALAAEPNVVCKLSGLLTEDGPEWTVEHLRRYVDHLLEHFGPARLMWGSDWPVCLLRAGYDQWAKVADELLSTCTADERRQILVETAVSTYQLDT